MSADELGLVGKTLERLRFDACVDVGGFGVVYRAFDLPRGVLVAVKCLRIPYATRSNPELAKSVEGRFQDESKLLMKLSTGHPDIVRCHGSGTLDAPATRERTPYMVLEWLEGRTLAAELRERRGRPDAPRPLPDVLALLDSAVSALAYAHAQEVIHRDVKPANLFLAKTSEGVRLKVLDFGVAKILVDDIIGMKPSVETGLGVQFCSPAYGAPEQFSPKVGAMGPWTDVYALALVVLELLTGARVRPASTLADGALKALDPKTGSPTASSLGLSLPGAVEEVLAQAVAQDPRKRPRDAGVFWAALREAAARPSHAPPANAGGLGGTMLMVPGAPNPLVAAREQAIRAFGGTMLMASSPQRPNEAARPITAPLARPMGLPGSPLAASPAPPPVVAAAAPAMSPLAASLADEAGRNRVVAPPPEAPTHPPPRPSFAGTPSLLPLAQPAPAMPRWAAALLITIVGALVGAAILAGVLWRR